jgi:hypothetical protein
MRRKVQLGGLLAAAMLAAAFPASAKEGFGLLSKKVATIVRVSPPAVFVRGTRFQVTSNGSSQVNGDLARRLQSQLESELIGRDSRLVADASRPEILIEVSILENNKSERWEDRQESVVVQTGTNAKGKPVFDTRQVMVRYKVVTHAFAVSYKISDRVKELSLDANSLRFDFSNAYREGEAAPEMFTLESSAIGQTVDAIARRITPTREKIGVLLPRGNLDDIANLAVAGQWNVYLESLERRAPSPKPADEAYRLYAMGVAYEALGYAAEDPAETLKYLEQASANYNKAIETNPGEKFFAQSYVGMWAGKKAAAPLSRVQEALANYRKSKDFQEQHAAVQAAAAAEEVRGGKSLDARAQGVDNAAVIRMTKAGLPKDIILTAIDTATKPSFDISPQGLIALSEAKVDRTIIQHIQEVATGKKGHSSRPAVKKKTTAAGRPTGNP